MECLKRIMKREIKEKYIIIIIFALVGGVFGLLSFRIGNLLSFYWVKNRCIFDAIFWLIAFAWSSFLALYAYKIHPVYDGLTKNNKPKRTEGYERLHCSQRVHQFVFNFLGGFVGWLILYFFLAQNNMLVSSAWWEKILLLSISFLGINGYLPYMITKSWPFGKP